MVAGTELKAGSALALPIRPGAAGAGQAPALPLSLRIRETVSAYLPLLLMAALALATWWLVENAPQAEDAQPSKPLLHIPDYRMKDFAVERFAADGRLQVRIEGSELRHFPDTDTIEVDQPRIHAFAPDGSVTVANARRAVSNSDGSEVQLLGGAKVLRQAAVAGTPAIEFHGEFLHAFFRTEEVRSHLPVQIRQGSTQLQADSLDYKHIEQRLQLNGRVRATFAPRTQAQPAPRSK